MSRLARSFALLLSFTGLLLGAADANALACTSVATGNWGVAGTWTSVGNCNRVPTAADTVTIATGHTVTVNVATANVLSVTVNAGAILTQSSALNSAGILSVAGTLNSTNTMAIGGATTVTGALNITATTGTRTFTGLVTVNAGGVWNNSINELVTFRGGITNNGTFTAGTGTQTFNLTQAIGGTSPINFGGIVAVVGAVTVTNNNTNIVTIAGNLTGSAVGSTWVNAANSTLNYGGALAPVATGVLNAAAVPNTVNYNGGAAQAVKTANYNNLTVTKAAGIATTAAGTVNVTGALTVTSGTLNIAGSTVVVTGATNVSGTLGITNATGTKTFTGAVTVNPGGIWSNTANEAVSMGSNLANSGTFTSGTGTYTFTGATQWTGGSLTFAGPVVANNNLSVNVSGTVAQNGTLSVAGNLAVLAGTHNLANTAAVTGTTSVSGTLGITSATGTKTFTGAVTINSGGSLSETVAELITYGGNVTINNGGTLTEFGAATMACAGNFQNDGTYTASTGVHTFSGATKTFSGANPIVIPSVTVSGTYQNNGTLTIATTLAGAGTLTNTGTLNIGAASVTPTLNATAVGNIVNYNRAGIQTIKATTYHHLTLSGTSAKTAAAGLTVNGDFTLSGAASFTASTFTHNFAGNWIINTTAIAPLSVATTSVINFNTPAIPAPTSMGGTTTATIAFADVNINNTSGVTFNDNASFQTGTTPTLTVAAGATLTPAPTVVISGTTGTLTGSGTVQVTRTAAVANFASQYTIATRTLTNLTVDFAGVGTAQTVDALTYGSATGGGLTVSNASGVSLAANTTVAGTLTLAGGVVSAGAFTLISSGDCTTKVARTSGHVAGLLQLRFPTGAPSCTFHVGDATAYRPINASFASVTVAGNLVGSVSQAAGEHPNIATSGLDSTKDVNRYWTLTNPVGGTIAYTTYTATFNFINPADFDAGATPASFEIERWDGAAWNVTTLGAATSTSTSASGLPSFIANSSNSFAVGEKKSTVVSINRADPSPTSAASVSWTVTFSASVSGVTSGNFTLVNSGLGGTPAITLVSGGGTTWTVTASTGTGTGTLGLNMANTTGVTPTVTNLPFTGQVYSIVGAGVINTYYPGTASVLAGATSITLGAATGATTPIAIGDTLLIMQMQDATIDSTNTAIYGTVSAANAGLYEYAIAASAVPLGGGALSLLPCGIINAYTNAAYVSGSSGQKRFQVIRVPVYASYTINAITALAWNGSTGGVLAFDVTGALNLNTATVDVSGMGFRGGASRTLAGGAGVNTDYLTLATVNNNASKGEGIAGTPYYLFTAPSALTNTGVEGYPNGSHARGAPANGGGGGTDRNPVANDQNPGGGGGANAGAGGLGGIGWCPTFNAAAPPLYGCGPNSGGLGGNPVTGLGATRLTLGGGGGGGTTNNGTGALAGGLSSSGAAGGGIIMLRTGSMTGAATFNANGSNGDSTIRNDGSGGGGAGGGVLISTGSGIGGATINVNGGIGGSNLVPPGTTSPPHGPGGGGGGGYAITTGAPAASSAAAGANGVTYNVGVLFGAYGATAGSAGSSNPGLTATAIPGVALGATACTAPLDHLEIQHASGTGLTCVANTLTIKACTDTAIPCVTPYTGGVTGTLSATGTPTVNWDGTTGGAAGAGFVIPNGSSSVTKDVQVATAGSVVFGITSPSPVPTNPTTCNFGAPSCTFTADTAGFIFSDSATGNTAYTIPALTSGTAQNTDNLLRLRAVQASTANAAVCTPAIISQTVTVDMGYTCNNPAACQAGNLGVINGTAIAPAGTPVSLAFDANGSAKITSVRYDDVGEITLTANKTVTPFGGGTAITLNGNSNAFVVKPAEFVISGIKCSTIDAANCGAGALAMATPGDNPAAADAAGVTFIRAGHPFTVTVTAKNALGNTTKNYGQETTAESVKLTSVLAGGLGLTNNPMPGGTFGAFSNGEATGTAFTWNEAGIVTLTPSVGDGDYLGAGDTTGTTSGNVGRFYAAKFALSGGVIANRTGLGGVCAVAGCDTFTYMGEQMSAVFNLTAQAADGTTTLQNYNYSATPANNFAKLDPTSAGNPLALAAVDTGTPRTVATLDTTTYGVASGNFGDTTKGIAFITAPFAVVRGASPSGPFDALDVGVAPVDGDGAALATLDLAVNAGGTPNTHGKVGSTKARYGRMNLSNAHGSELLPLTINVAAQYWNSTTYVTNALDNDSIFAATDVILNNYTKNLASGETSVITPPASVVFTGGVASYQLARPSGGDGKYDGSVNMTVNALSTYLPSNTARATFGVYKGNNEFIYLRETY